MEKIGTKRKYLSRSRKIGRTDKCVQSLTNSWTYSNRRSRKNKYSDDNKLSTSTWRMRRRDEERPLFYGY